MVASRKYRAEPYGRRAPRRSLVFTSFAVARVPKSIVSSLAFRSARCNETSGAYRCGLQSLIHSSSVLRAKQRLDRAALVHRAVTLSHLLQRQGQVEDLAGVDLHSRSIVVPRRVGSSDRAFTELRPSYQGE